MIFRRSGAGIAVVVATAMVLAACTVGGDVDSDTNGGVITVAELGTFSSFNPHSVSGNSEINSTVAKYTRSSFFYLDDRLELVPDTSFGTVEKVSDSPLTVTYTLAETAMWSDGTPVTADDMLFAWAIQSGFFDDAVVNDNGRVSSGTAYFDYAGDSAGLSLTDRPVISDDNRSMTLIYRTPYAGWQHVNPIDAPLHVVARHANVTVADVISVLTTLPRGVQAKPAEPSEELKAIADFWNTGFDANQLPSDAGLYVSSGGMVVDSWEPGHSVTLVKNPEYLGDLEPKVDKIVIRFIDDSSEQVTALRNGEVDVISPQSSVSVVSALASLENVTMLTGNQLDYDHLDLSFNAAVFKSASVRQAFLLTIPRQQILDEIAAPQDPSARLDNSLVFVPDSAGYDKSTATNGSDTYATVDIERAKELLDGATPEVRILYNSKNPRRVEAFQAIKASAEKAGFTIEDAGAENWGALLGGTSYDAAIFGQDASELDFDGIASVFGSKGGKNYNAYSNSKVDALVKSLLSDVDANAQESAMIQIDTLLFGDGYGVPLYFAPGVVAHSNTVSGVEYSPTPRGTGWNYWLWSKKK